MMNRSWVDIDLTAITANAKTLQSLAPSADLCAVVKANGYGHGAIEVAKTALAAGATRLAVAQVAEGVALRAAGIDAPIWVLSEPDPEELPAAMAADLEPTVYSERGIDATIGAAATSASGVVPARMTVHVKVDTGMHRVGADPVDVVALTRRIAASPVLTLDSVFTHLATADEPSEPASPSFTESQLDRYEEVLADLAAAGIEVPLCHAANSAGTIAYPRSHYDVVRCGISLYGLPPSDYLAGRAELRPALSWRTKVGFVKRLWAGDAVSYGQRTTVDRYTTVATIPVGYADGYHRRLWDTGGHVLIGGRRRPIIGVVTMDQTVVDCGDDDVAPGDEVVLIGTQAGETVTADDLARSLGTINYEIVTSIGTRVGRRYHGT